MAEEAAFALISDKQAVSLLCHFGNLRQFCWSGDRGVRKSSQQPGGLHRAAFTKIRKPFEDAGKIESGKNLLKLLRRAQSSQPDQQTKVASQRGPSVIPQKPIVDLIDSKRRSSAGLLQFVKAHQGHDRVTRRKPLQLHATWSQNAAMTEHLILLNEHRDQSTHSQLDQSVQVYFW